MDPRIKRKVFALFLALPAPLVMYPVTIVLAVVLMPEGGRQAPGWVFMQAVAMIVPALSGVVMLRREFGLWAYPIAIILTLIAVGVMVGAFFLLLRLFGPLEL